MQRSIQFGPLRSTRINAVVWAVSADERAREKLVTPPSRADATGLSQCKRGAALRAIQRSMLERTWLAAIERALI